MAWRYALAALVGLAGGGGIGALVGRSIFQSLRYLGDGGQPFDPAPLAEPFAAALAVLVFVAITATGIALALAIMFGASRPWRHANTAVATD
jgi:hypothetical protein